MAQKVNYVTELVFRRCSCNLLLLLLLLLSLLCCGCLALRRSRKVAEARQAPRARQLLEATLGRRRRRGESVVELLELLLLLLLSSGCLMCGFGVV